MCGCETFLQLRKEWKWMWKVGQDSREIDKWDVCDRTNKPKNIAFTAEGKLFRAKPKPDYLISSALVSLTLCIFQRNVSDTVDFSVQGSLTVCTFLSQNFWQSILSSAISLTMWLTMSTFQRNIADNVYFSAQHRWQCVLFSEISLTMCTFQRNIANNVYFSAQHR